MSKLVRVVSERIPRRFALDPVRDIQVLSPMNRGGLGARALNAALQQALNPPGDDRIERFGTVFGPGDKVMQVENDYDKDVFNGDQGIVAGLDIAAGELTVDFDGRRILYSQGELDELALAYATTIHKSQGSEYPAVVIPLATQHYPMLQRNLVYTGVTRQAPRRPRQRRNRARACTAGRSVQHQGSGQASLVESCAEGSVRSRRLALPALRGRGGGTCASRRGG